MERTYWALHLGKALFTAICISVVLPAKAQSDWLTVVGFPDDPAIDLVQVQLGSRPLGPDLQNINLRVNRAVTRTSTDGVVFRSFTATAVVDCLAKNGRFVTSAFYTLPLWQGEPHRTLSFSPTEVRPMLFRNIDPNPTERIVRAACSVATRTIPNARQ